MDVNGLDDLLAWVETCMLRTERLVPVAAVKALETGHPEIISYPEEVFLGGTLHRNCLVT